MPSGEGQDNIVQLIFEKIEADKDVLQAPPPPTPLPPMPRMKPYRELADLIVHLVQSEPKVARDVLPRVLHFLSWNGGFRRSDD